ncbi:MAG: phosphotransferase family protein [Parahaliea sp.]
MDRDTVGARLRTALAKRIDAPFSIDDLTLLTGGSAAQTWRFVLTREQGKKEYILRLAHGGEQFELGIDKRMEAKVQAHAVAHGVLAPAIIASLDESDQLGEGFIMELVRGETIPQRILRQDTYASARETLARQCGTLLAQIHQVPVAELAFLPDRSASPQLASLRSFYEDSGETVPVFEYAFHWLERHLPQSRPTTLVHADFRNGNLIIDATGVTAILDWELAHLGDPMEDLGWLCVNSWRFGVRDKPVGGFGSREQLYCGYRAAGGAVDEAGVFFWEVLGVLKWGLICLYQTAVHLRGEERSVNRAAIGRRVSETELDLLALLCGAPAA